MRVFGESCTLSDISSMRRRTVRDERLTLSKTERCSGQTESTTATRHSLMKSPSENGFIRRARMRETSYLARTILSASAVCLRKNDVVFCRLPDNLSMASFLSTEDIDPKFDARCSASQWRRMLNSLRTATVFKHMRHWACPKRSIKSICPSTLD